MSELKPCPNPVCNASDEGIEQHMENDQCWVACQWCGLNGPLADSHNEAARLWNALPRPTADTVERAALDMALRNWMRVWAEFGDDTLLGDRLYGILERYFRAAPSPTALADRQEG